MVAVIAALVILFLPSFVATFCAPIRQRHCGRDDATPVAAITLGLVKQQGYALSSAAMKRSITGNVTAAPGLVARILAGTGMRMPALALS